MSFISLSKITYIFLERDVRFGNQGAMRADIVDNIPEKFNYMVCFFEMNRGRSNLLPQVGDSIQANEPDTFGQVQKKNINKFKQYLRIGKIQVNLVFAESGPYMPQTIVGFRRYK